MTEVNLAPQRPAQPPARNEPCWCGSGKKYKKCHLREDRAAGGGGRVPGFTRIRRTNLKTPEQIEGIRRAGAVTRDILDDLVERVRPGITTEEIDRYVHETMVARGGVPATLGYKGYTKSCCTSINEVVCHGIPGERRLEEGDIVNIDVTTILDGYFGDASCMYLVGEVDDEARRLVGVTRECLDRGIAQVRPGGRLHDIGAAIQQHAEAAGYSVVRTFGGHGTGTSFHEEPFVPHFGNPGEGPELIPGMVFTIEPMVNVGTYEVEVLDDGWTAVTEDRSLSAQWEHTVAVAPDGVDILTR